MFKIALPFSLRALLALYFTNSFVSSFVYLVSTSTLFNPLFDRSLPLTSPSLRAFFLGLLIAAFFIGQLAGLPLFIKWNRHASLYSILIISAIGMLTGLLISGMALEAFHYTQTVIGRFITGLFTANFLLILCSFFHKTNIYPIHGSFYRYLFPISSAGLMSGFLVGGIFSDSAISSQFNAPLTYWIASGLVAVVLVFLLLPANELAHIHTPIHQLQPLHHKIKQMKEKKLIILYFLFILGWLANLQFIPLFFFQLFNTPSLLTSLILVAIIACYFIGALFIHPILARLFSIKNLYLFAGAGAALFALLITLGDQLYFSIICHLLLAIYAGILWSHSTPSGQTLQALYDNQVLLAIAAIIAPLVDGLLTIIDVRLIDLFSFFLFFLALIITFFLPAEKEYN